MESPIQNPFPPTLFKPTRLPLHNLDRFLSDLYARERVIEANGAREMAQVSKISSGVRTPQFLPEIPKSQKPNSVNLFSVRSPFVGAPSFRGLKYGDEMRGNSVGGRVGAVVPLRVSASAATTEKPSTVPEIVLQPIKEISGTIHLPGSKSLSNRILLLAALSEVWKIVGFFLF